MSNSIGRSFPPSGANPPNFNRGRVLGRAPRIEGDSVDVKPERTSFGNGGARVRGSRPAPEPAAQTVERSRGVSIEFASRETVSLELKTDDGDSVSISFEALSRIQGGVRSDGAQSVSAQSFLEVRVKVEGTLDDEETGQIKELLQRLVTAARSGEPAAMQSDGLDSLDSFRFAYDAYRRAGLETVEARFA